MFFFGLTMAEIQHPSACLSSVPPTQLAASFRIRKLNDEVTASAKAKGTLGRPEFTGDVVPLRNGTRDELSLWTPLGSHLEILRKCGLERGSTIPAVHFLCTSPPGSTCNLQREEPQPEPLDFLGFCVPPPCHTPSSGGQANLWKRKNWYL